MKRWLKRIGIAMVVLLGVAGIGVGLVSHKMRQWDARHAQFLACGKTINNFLKIYAKNAGEAFQQNDASQLVQHYSTRYASPERGNWSLGEREDIGDVGLFNLRVVGNADFDRDLLHDEVAEYLGNIGSTDRVKCKINLIEDVEPDKSAQLTVKYILDGRDKAGHLFQDRFFFRWWLELEQDPAGLDTWKIVRDELVEGRDRLGGSEADMKSGEEKKTSVDGYRTEDTVGHDKKESRGNLKDGKFVS